jgi:hypothetical protein
VLSGCRAGAVPGGNCTAQAAGRGRGAYDGAVKKPVDEAGVIDYSLALPLDAEALAEEGILDAYCGIVPLLADLGIRARPATSDFDSSDGSYSIDFDGRKYEIVQGCPPDDRGSQADDWGMATYVPFDIVNRQLAATDVRLCAISGGNDLFGIPLTAAQADRARRALPSEPPWFGMFH